MNVFFLFPCKCLSVCTIWSHFDIAQWFQTSYSRRKFHESSRKWSINAIISSSPCLHLISKRTKRNCKTKHEKHISVVSDNAESSRRVFSIVLTTAAELSCLWKKERKSREEVGWVSTMPRRHWVCRSSVGGRHIVWHNLFATVMCQS